VHEADLIQLLVSGVALRRRAGVEIGSLQQAQQAPAVCDGPCCFPTLAVRVEALPAFELAGL
jgi:hypothetical protein